MAILRTEDIRKMNANEQTEELDKLKTGTHTERAIASAGGAPESPGRIGEIRKTIARIKTIQKEPKKE